MAGTVLVSSTGFGFAEKTCLSRDERTVTLQGSQKGCCSQKAAVTSAHAQSGTCQVQKTDCCKVGKSYARVQFESLLTKIGQFFAALAANLIELLLAPFRPALLQTEAVPHPPTGPAPPAGRALLIHISLFQV